MKPEGSEGFSDPAGQDAGWAQGLVPAVSSGFVWLAAKANGIGVVTNNVDEQLSDFSPVAVAGGARVALRLRAG
jgi:hypothetical protein